MTASERTFVTEGVSSREGRSLVLPVQAVPQAQYLVEHVIGTQRVLDRLEALPAAGTGFQDARWLGPLLSELAPCRGAEPSLIIATDRESGELSLALPVLTVLARGLRKVTFPDLGVSDYGAPLLGPAAPRDAKGAAMLLAALREAFKGVDVLDLGNMLREIGGRANPLALVRGAAASRHSAHRVYVADTIEAFLRSRGKKFRKEVERCTRLLDKAGPWTLRRAETAAEIGAAYAVLEQQQGVRWQQNGGTYMLAEAAYSSFYARLLHEGAEDGFAHIFTLDCGEEVVAVLLGIERDGVFTLLRISNAGDRWRHVSPGRLIVVEAMRYFIGRGVRTFDMGIGDYAFKDGFGVSAEPLADLVLPCTWKALPYAAHRRVRAWAWRSGFLKSLVRRLRLAR